MGFYHDFKIIKLLGEEKVGRSWQEELLGKLSFRENLLVITDGQKIIDFCQEKKIPVAAVETGKEPLVCNFILQDFNEVEDAELERIYCRCLGLPWIPFESEHFLFREFALWDLDALFDLYSQPHVLDYLDPLFEYEEEKVYQENYIRYIYEFYNFGLWLVFDKNSGELVGRAGVESTERCGSDELELGYVINPKFWGRGFATEINRAILDYSKENLGVSNFIARCNQNNAASVATLKKLGFVLTVEKLTDTEDLWSKKAVISSSNFVDF